MTLYSLSAAVHLLYLYFSSHATFKASVFQQNYKLMRQVVSVTEIGVICKRVLRKGVIYWLRKVPSEQSHQHDSRRSRDSLASSHKICSSVFYSSRMYMQRTLLKMQFLGPSRQQLTLTAFHTHLMPVGTHCGGLLAVCHYNRKWVPNIQLCFISFLHILKKPNEV